MSWTECSSYFHPIQKLLHKMVTHAYVIFLSLGLQRKIQVIDIREFDIYLVSPCFKCDTVVEWLVCGMACKSLQ